MIATDIRHARAVVSEGRGTAAGALWLAGIVLCAGSVVAAAEPTTAEASKAEATTAEATTVTAATGDQIARGREIFLREWIPGDPRSHGGDGLGPVFNDSSCVACHNQGGHGGAGPAGKNVEIISATFNAHHLVRSGPRRPAAERFFRSLMGLTSDQARRVSDKQLEELRSQLLREARRLHPGLASAQSVVLHHFGTGDDYDQWRREMRNSNQFGQFGMMQSTVIMNEPPVSVELVDNTVVNTVVTEGELPAEPAQQAGAIDETAPNEDSADEPAEAEAAATPSTPDATPPVPFIQLDPSVNFALQPTGPNVDFAGMHRASMHINRLRQPIQTQLSMTAFATQRGNFAITFSARNPTALFGVGLIDSIPDEAILERAKIRHADFQHVSGRPAKLADGKIGRFGWKAQKATLHDFTMTACAVELGLHVPAHAQSGSPRKPDYEPAGFDLTQQEADTLVEYLRHLPAPAAEKPATEAHSKYLAKGRELFVRVGCEVCHAETLGEVTGIYSDLLLHHLGEELGDTGSYGVFLPNSPGGDAEGVVPPLARLKQIRDGQEEHAAANTGPAGQAQPATEIRGATRAEWRTPPLWGVRDSAPYLHDGRAATLEQAIAFHGGEATESARRYFMLSAEERQHVQAFLKSLTAPQD